MHGPFWAFPLWCNLGTPQMIILVPIRPAFLVYICSKPIGRFHPQMMLLAPLWWYDNGPTQMMLLAPIWQWTNSNDATCPHMTMDQPKWCYLPPYDNGPTQMMLLAPIWQWTDPNDATCPHMTMDRPKWCYFPPPPPHMTKGLIFVTIIIQFSWIIWDRFNTCNLLLCNEWCSLKYFVKTFVLNLKGKFEILSQIPWHLVERFEISWWIIYSMEGHPFTTYKWDVSLKLKGKMYDACVWSVGIW